MPEVVGAVVFVVGLAFLLVLIWWFDADDRDERRFRKAKDKLNVRASANHQELFLLVNDLVLLQDRGYVSLFPDEETLARAKKALAAYRLEIGP